MHRSEKGLGRVRTVAVLEAAKGILALLALNTLIVGYLAMRHCRLRSRSGTP